MNGPRRVEIGAYECWILPDGDLTYPGPIVTPPGAETPSEVAVPYTAFLIDTGSTRILLDTGAGALGPRTGRLQESLEAAGFMPEDIHTVILSHAHPDHIGGVGRFPNAAVVMMRREFEFWTDAETQARLAAGALYGLGALERTMAASFRDHLLPAKDRLRLLDQPTEVASGVLVFSAPGHTPGHAAVLVSSERQQLLYVGDAIIHPAHFQSPDWVTVFDLAHDETVATRKELMERAAADRCLLAAYHLPGAIGTVIARQSQFHWEPLTTA